MSLARIGDKGRVTIPKKVRERLGVKGSVHMTFEGEAVVITPPIDAHEEMKKIIAKPINDVASSVRALKRKAEEAALKAVKKRWR